MSVLLSGGSGDSLSANLTLTQTYPMSVSMWVYVPAGFTANRFILAMDLTTSGIDGFWGWSPRAGTTSGFIDLRLSTDGPGAGTANIDDTDTFAEDTWTNLIFTIESQTNTDQKAYVGGTFTYSPSASRDIINSSNGLDRIIIGNQDPTANFCCDCYIAEVAVWYGTLLSSGNISDLQTKTPDNIGNTPTYYWDLLNDINGNIGGVNLTENGTSPYTQQSGTHPTLIGPSTGPTKLLGSSTKLLGATTKLIGI